MRPEIIYGIGLGLVMIATDAICKRYNIGPSVGDVVEWWKRRRATRRSRASEEWVQTPQGKGRVLTGIQYDWGPNFVVVVLVNGNLWEGYEHELETPPKSANDASERRLSE